MTTPTDSAMTASAVRDILERLDYASKSKTFGSDDEASMVRVAHRVIRTLTADLARVEGEAREKVAQFMIGNSIATGHGDTIDDLLSELGGQYQDIVSRTLAAEAKAARLEEALDKTSDALRAIAKARSRTDRMVAVVAPDGVQFRYVEIDRFALETLSALTLSEPAK